MIKDKFTRALLFGKTAKVNENLNVRNFSIDFPGNDEEFYRSISFRADDGIILYFIKRIEKLEKNISDLTKKHGKTNS